MTFAREVTRRGSLAALGSAFVYSATRAHRAWAEGLWEGVLSRPILDGEDAAGVRLGDSVTAVERALGRPPDKIDPFPEISCEMHLYEVAPPDREWIAGIDVTYVLERVGVAAIRVMALHRGSAPLPYTGRTKRGYALGESVTRLRRLYGEPDDAFAFSAVDPKYLWYRAVGLVFLPGLESSGNYRGAQVVVVSPNLARSEALRLVLGQRRSSADRRAC